MKRLTLAALLALLPIGSTAIAQDGPNCETYRITWYSAEDYPGWTRDGTTTTVGALNRGEPIAAASYNVPLGAYVQVIGEGVYRVADRGSGLSAKHIDILTRTHAKAIENGSVLRTVCLYE